MHRNLLVQLIGAASIVVAACGGSPTGPDSDLPNYQGVWQGAWVQSSCTGAACDVAYPSGALRLTLTQSGATVQGIVEIDALPIPAAGSVNSDGALSLTGSVNQGAATIRVGNWSTIRSGDRLTGTFALTLVPTEPQIGSQTVGVTLQNVTKTS